ncbi:DUF4175 family protein [Tundrisphaera sp. TA3]|uniref:DUF4175 family protein n=1 Tax=Tundrisphaera sp. TA3 TaxID=3435775 RepID=UPI003EB95688
MRGPVESRIAALRGRVRRLLALHGLSWLVAGTLLAIVVACLADYLVHLAPEIRLALLMGVIGLAGYLLVRRVLMPLIVRFRDLDIALRIEDRWPGLNDRLASTVQFLRAAESAPESEFGSRALRDATVAQTLEQIRDIDFRQAVDPRPARKAAAWALAALALVGMIALAEPRLARIGALRLFRPYGPDAWPRNTHLTILDETPRKIAKGMPFALAVRIGEGERMPATARVTYRYADGETSSEPLRPAADNTFRGRIETVTQPFTFRVEAGDDITDRRKVEVVPPPALTRNVVKLTAPAYTGLPPQTLAPGNTQVRVVEGSRVEIEAEANKALASATLRVGDAILNDAVKLAPGGKALAASFTVKESRPFWFDLLDTEGFRSQEIVRFDVRATRDEAPRVNVDDPSQDRDVPVGATVPLRFTVEDDFGTHLVRLIYRVASGDSEPANEVVVPLWEAPAPGAKGPQEVAYRWDLKPIPGLQPGSTITFFADARDFDDLKGPNIGKSREIRLRIASDEEIQRQRDEQQKAIHDEIDRALQMQKQARTPVADALRTLDQTPKLPDDARARLKDAEMIQRQVTNRITNKSDGLDQKIRKFLEDGANFNIKNPDAEQQMAEMRDAVQRIRERNLTPAEQGLTRATKALDQADGKDDAGPNEPNPADQAEPRADGQNEPNAASKASGKNEPKSGGTPKGDPKAGEPNEPKAGESARGQDVASKDEPNAGGESKGQPKSKGQNEPNKGGTPKGDPGEAGKNEPNKGDTSKSGQPQGGESSKSAQSKSGAEPKAQGQSAPQPAGGETKPTPDGQPDAGETKPTTPKASLADAEKNQKAIVDELEKMLAGMSEFNNVRNLTREAKSLIQAQEQANKKAAEAASNPETAGKDQDALSPEQKAERGNQAAAQNEIAKGLQNLEAKLDEAAKNLEATDPLAAAGLREAAEQSRKKQTAARMGEGADQLGRNQMGQARENQQKATEDLKQLADAIQNRRERELSHLVKELKNAEADLKKLRDRQAANLKKTAEARKNPDEANRKEELAKLAKEQQQIQEETKRQVQKLAKLSAEAAARAGQQAAGQMAKAGEQMEQGDGEQAEQDQEEALQNLREAQQEVAAARREAEEQLAAEQIVKMADSLKSIHERQEKMAEETGKYEKTRADAEGKLTLAQRSGVRELGRVQAGLKDEAGELGDRLGEGAPVFKLAIKKASEGMETAAQRLQTLKTDEGTVRAQKLAALRLRQLLDSLKQEQGKKGGQQGGDQQGGGQQGGQQGGGDGFPPAAQIKMLKMLQQEINERTDFFDELLRRHKELTPEQTAEIDQLHQDQGSLADLVRDLTQPKKDDGEE